MTDADSIASNSSKTVNLPSYQSEVISYELCHCHALANPGGNKTIVLLFMHLPRKLNLKATAPLRMVTKIGQKTSILFSSCASNVTRRKCLKADLYDTICRIRLSCWRMWFTLHACEWRFWTFAMELYTIIVSRSNNYIRRNDNRIRQVLSCKWTINVSSYGFLKSDKIQISTLRSGYWYFGKD